MNELIKKSINRTFYIIAGMFTGYFFGEDGAFEGMLILIAIIIIFELAHVGLIKYTEGKENETSN